MNLMVYEKMMIDCYAEIISGKSMGNIIIGDNIANLQKCYIATI
ncbi:unnamed protein product [Commensalibacter communis]|nr:unnamed protein product [Commensalibacter communis]CAI3939966.1 unnamed protein product [Commensalibacter communis]CAI3939969.1 unnamed protein product [Commensalibacter communis]